VHGDYSPKNVLIHGGRLTLLDHEVIHWGDPAFDVGFSLTHLLSKAHHRPARRRDFADAARTHWAIYHRRVAGEPWADGLESCLSEPARYRRQYRPVTSAPQDSRHILEQPRLPAVRMPFRWRPPPVRQSVGRQP
jgi:aminoglycoside phosphotransferase (APT) family kinase protein